MERGFYNEDIEELLKQKADQYRMYPSDKVWKGIQRSLHPSRKWYWFGFILFLSAIGYYAFVELFVPSATKAVSETSSPSTTSPATQPANESPNTKTAVIVPFGTSQKQNSIRGGSDTKQSSFVLNPDYNSGVAANDAAPVAEDNNTMAFNNEAPVFDITTRRLVHDIHELSDDKLALLVDEYEQQQSTTAATGTEPLAPGNISTSDAAQLNKLTSAEQEDGQRVNWLHELAVYELQQQKPKHLSWQIAFTPTMNYRKLTSNNRFSTPSDTKNLPVNGEQVEGDPNDLVNHKPALGFEFGSHLMYAANKTFTFKAGLQFNYSRYDIQAYSSSQTERATIALNSSTGITSNPITTYTRIRNFGGKEVENLRNQYFQLSAPIGLEINLLGNDKLQVGVAGTIQPTYLLNRNTYLITTDYKNYTKEPSLVRKMNVHTSAEAFVAYKTGGLKWQVGPQFRYQLLSSYVREYPIREQLMEFGIKIGVAKTIR